MRINKSIFLIALIFLIYSILSGLSIGYLLLFYAVIISLAMYYLVYRAGENIDVFIYISDQVNHVGDKVNVEYKIINLSVLPMPRVNIKLKVSKKLSDIYLHEKKIYLGPYNSYSLKNEIMLKRRGIFSIGKLEIELSDYFKIFTKKIAIDKNINLKVYPKVIDVKQLKITPQEFFGNFKVDKVAYEDFTSVNRVRPTLPGDSKKRIHWKISSKYDEFYTKIFDLTADANAHILLNTYKRDFDQDEHGIEEEKMVSYCLSLIKYFLENKIEIILTYFLTKKNEIIGSSLKDYNKFLQELTLVEMESNVSLIKLLEDYEKKKINSTIVLITLEVDDLLNKKIHVMKHKGFEIYLIEIGSDQYDFEL